MKALVLHDSVEMANNISSLLRLRWPSSSTIHVPGSANVVEAIEREHPDLVVFGASPGSSLTSEIRRFYDLPLVALTTGRDRISGIRELEMGADDFLAVPFDDLEFLARVAALNRRARYEGPEQDTRPLVCGDLTVDLAAHEIILCGNQIRLTPTEFKLLTLFVRNEKRVLTHDMLLDNAWEHDDSHDKNAIKKYILRLRRKLHDDPKNPQMLASIRGIGYRFIRPGSGIPQTEASR